MVGPAVAPRPQFRNDKPVRVRRPIALRAQNSYIPSVAPRIQEESKPVTESAEDEQPDVFLPQLLREQQLVQAQQAQFQQQANAFLNGEVNTIHDTPSLPQLLQDDEHILAPSPQPALPSTRFTERPTPTAPLAATTSNNRPAFNDYGIGSFGAQRFGLERPQQSAPAPAPLPQQAPQRVNVIRTRPQVRESRPQYEAQSAPQPAPAPVRSRPRPAPARPAIEYNQVQQEEREQPQQRRQRPVAQTIRKWREENEDGSITWGYENDDGSFKEEIIGTDCVTKLAFFAFFFKTKTTLIFLFLLVGAHTATLIPMVTNVNTTMRPASNVIPTHVKQRKSYNKMLSLITNRIQLYCQMALRST